MLSSTSDLVPVTIKRLEKGFEEANPIMASMIGTYAFPLVKLLLVPLLLIAIWQNRDRLRVVATKFSWIPFLCYFILMIYYRCLLVGQY